MTLSNKSLMAEMGQTLGHERKKKRVHGRSKRIVFAHLNKGVKVTMFFVLFEQKQLKIGFFF